MMASCLTDSREDLNPLPSKHVVRSAEYSYRPPSPPLIDVPLPRKTSPGPVLELVPSYEHVGLSQLTSEDLQIITQNTRLLAFDNVASWVYGNRYVAQAITDFLYLGPTSTIRNHEFLTGQGITMIVVVRNSHFEGTIRSVDRASQELGISLEYVRVGGLADLMQALSNVISLINGHLLSVHHSRQPKGRTDGGHGLLKAHGPGRGKVLITCDSGNDYSAAIAAAYVVSVFGQSAVSSVQFVQLKRFCCTFDEDVKHMLQSWEDIARARSMTASCLQPGRKVQPLSQDAKAHARRVKDRAIFLAPSETKLKRGFDDMMDLELGTEKGALCADEDRFIDRDPFVPFIDVSGFAFHDSAYYAALAEGTE